MINNIAALYVFIISGWADDYGRQEVKVIAQDFAGAMVALAGLDPLTVGMFDMCGDVTVKRGSLAVCNHGDAEGSRFDEADDLAWDKINWTCEWCPTTWTGNDHPAPSATAEGFRAYCANLRQHAE